MKKKITLSLAMTLGILTGTHVFAAGDTTTYTIQSGDTLWAVSQKFSVSLSDVMAANPTLNPNNLYIGYKMEK